MVSDEREADENSRRTYLAAIAGLLGLGVAGVVLERDQPPEQPDIDSTETPGPTPSPTPTASPTGTGCDYSTYGPAQPKDPEFEYVLDEDARTLTIRKVGGPDIVGQCDGNFAIHVKDGSQNIVYWYGNRSGSGERVDPVSDYPMENGSEYTITDLDVEATWSVYVRVTYYDTRIYGNSTVGFVSSDGRQNP